MSGNDIIETFEDGVYTVTLNRPQARNALNEAMMKTLEDIMLRLAKDAKVRCIVLTGAGGAFCAGGDIGNFEAGKDDPAAAAAMDAKELTIGLRRRSRLTEIVHAMPKPTLAVIPGAVAGAGLSLAMACDMRIAVDTAKITTAFARIGVSGDYGGTYFMTKLLGLAKTKELYFTADVISGQEAFRIGLVSQVTTADALEREARALALRLAGMPTVAIGFMKQNIDVATRGTLGELLDIESSHMVQSLFTEDHKIGVRAFKERAAPQFGGR